MRKLASVQIIEETNPIENADAIDTARVLGWQVVVKKGEFSPGDKCVYCEIDSVLPKKPEFEFLHSSNFRIRTVRLRGKLSQGICFPLSILPEGSWAVGDDVTEVLGVEKYDPPIPLEMDGQVKSFFPGYVPKTDESRIQSFPGLLDEMRGQHCFRTMKIDGTSTSFIHRGGELHVCGRNLSFIESDNNIHWRMFRKYKLDESFVKAGNYAIQGETAGPGIEKNPYGAKELSLFVFNVYDIDAACYLSFADYLSFCARHKLLMAPVLDPDFVLDHDIPQLLEMAQGSYPSGKNQEGIVIRPLKEQVSEVLNGRLSFKVINNDHLLKKKD